MLPENENNSSYEKYVTTKIYRISGEKGISKTEKYSFDKSAYSQKKQNPFLKHTSISADVKNSLNDNRTQQCSNSKSKTYLKNKFKNYKSKSTDYYKPKTSRSLYNNNSPESKEKYLFCPSVLESYVNQVDDNSRKFYFAPNINLAKSENLKEENHNQDEEERLIIYPEETVDSDLAFNSKSKEGFLKVKNVLTYGVNFVEFDDNKSSKKTISDVIMNSRVFNDDELKKYKSKSVAKISKKYIQSQPNYNNYESYSKSTTNIMKTAKIPKKRGKISQLFNILNGEGQLSFRNEMENAITRGQREEKGGVVDFAIQKNSKKFNTYTIKKKVDKGYKYSTNEITKSALIIQKWWRNIMEVYNFYIEKIKLIQKYYKIHYDNMLQLKESMEEKLDERNRKYIITKQIIVCEDDENDGYEFDQKEFSFSHKNNKNLVCFLLKSFFQKKLSDIYKYLIKKIKNYAGKNKKIITKKIIDKEEIVIKKYKEINEYQYKYFIYILRNLYNLRIKRLKNQFFMKLYKYYIHKLKSKKSEPITKIITKVKIKYLPLLLIENKNKMIFSTSKNLLKRIFLRYWYKKMISTRQPKIIKRKKPEFKHLLLKRIMFNIIDKIRREANRRSLIKCFRIINGLKYPLLYYAFKKIKKYGIVRYRVMNAYATLIQNTWREFNEILKKEKLDEETLSEEANTEENINKVQEYYYEERENYENYDNNYDNNYDYCI